MPAATAQRPKPANPMRRSWALPTPVLDPITFQGDPMTAPKIVQLWNDGSTDLMRESRRQIETVQQFRRRTLRVDLSPSWERQHPDIASWVKATSTMAERTILEQDQITRTGAVEPELQREATGKLERDKTNARKLRAYLEEHKRQCIPVQTFFGKSIEDGQYGRITIPSDADIDGMPDFYERLDEDAYRSLADEKKREYRKDETDRKGRYARYTDGRKQPGESWERDAKGRSRFEVGKDGEFKRDYAKSKDAHDEAIREYLLQRQASNTRVIPALDCVPFFKRGKNGEPWDLACLVERSLFYPEELIEQNLGWVGMGDRLLVPRGFVSGRAEGQKGQFYLYTAYLTCRDAQNRERPIIAYCVGGYGTFTSGDDPDSSSCAVIDLYAKYGIEGPLWSYHGGAHTNDDDPNYYWFPYMAPFVEPIMALEGDTMAIRAATAVNAFTGHIYTPDAKLAEVAPEALIETGTSRLKRPKIPQAGESEVAGGTFTPFAQARVGEDAWRLRDSATMDLVRNTSSSQVPMGSGASGRTMVVGAQLALTAQRQTRDSVLNATVRSAEDHLKIVDAIACTFDVCWPIQTLDELTEDPDVDPSRDPVEFDPEWVKGKRYKLKAEYPPEENLARRDMAIDAYERGVGTFDDVQKEAGKKDPFNERVKILKDQMWKDPANMLLLKNLVAKERGDEAMQKILQLQASGAQTEAGIPGFEQGVPTSMLASAPTHAGGPTAGSSSRGGQQAAEMNAMGGEADALAQLAAAAPTGGM